MVSFPDCGQIARRRGQESLVLGGIGFTDLRVVAAALGPGKMRLTGNGQSMNPFLMTGDRLSIEEKPVIREKDIVVFIRNRKLTAHRVCSIDKQKNKLITKGDNCTETEEISCDDVLGVVAEPAGHRGTRRWPQFKDKAIKYGRQILENKILKAFLKHLGGLLCFRYYVSKYEGPFSLQGRKVDGFIGNPVDKYMVFCYFLGKAIANGELVKMPDYCEFSGWWLNNLFVAPSFRGMGVEKKVFVKLINIARDLKINSVRFIPSSGCIPALSEDRIQIRAYPQWHEIIFPKARAK
jgi:GNAT superfamily N-acetyltransferase